MEMIFCQSQTHNSILFSERQNNIGSTPDRKPTVTVEQYIKLQIHYFLKELSFKSWSVSNVQHTCYLYIIRQSFQILTLSRLFMALTLNMHLKSYWYFYCNDLLGAAWNMTWYNNFSLEMIWDQYMALLTNEWCVYLCIRHIW